VETSDVIVIGGGIVGCATAYYLAARGIRPLLLERGGLASEASGANAGMVGASSGLPGKTLAHTKKSFELLVRDAEALGRPVELVRAGRLVLATSEAEWADVCAFAQSRQAAGIETRLLRQEELRSLEPGLGPAVLGGALVPGDGHVNPFLLTYAYAEGARRLGADIRPGVEVLRLDLSGDRVVGVLTPAGPIASSRVVVAAGAWSAPLVARHGVAVPVRPGRGQMLVTEALPPLTARVLRTPSIGIRQDVRGHVLIGSSVEDAGYSHEVTLPVLSEFCRLAAALMPALRDARIIRAWAGLRPMTPDSLPILDLVPGLEGAYLASGHSRTGMTYGPVTGWLAAQLIGDGRTELPLDPFRLERFEPAVAGAVREEG
jgi:glycine/D-amino acid oxidase-like deaminating enzyme